MKGNYCFWWIHHIITNFFCTCFFFSQTFMIHRTAGEGGWYFFSSSAPLPPALQTLRYYPCNYCRKLNSAYSHQQLDSNWESFVSGCKLLTTLCRLSSGLFGYLVHFAPASKFFSEKKLFFLKKTHFEKVSYIFFYFWRWNFLDPRLKSFLYFLGKWNFLIFSKKKKNFFSYIQEIEFSYIFLMFQEMELFSPSLKIFQKKKLLIFFPKKTHSEKISYIF